MANHYLVELVARSPASSWEEGQVENQVGNIREWFVHTAGTVCQLRGVERMAGNALQGIGCAQASDDPGVFDRSLPRYRPACSMADHRSVRWVCGAYAAHIQHLPGGAGSQSLQRFGGVCWSCDVGAQHGDRGARRGRQGSDRPNMRAASGVIS
jgi:hypothetical protein